MEARNGMLGFGDGGVGGGGGGLSPLMIMPLMAADTNNNNNNNTTTTTTNNNTSSSLLPPLPMDYHHQHHHDNSIIKSKIMSHPHFSSLLSAYINCQKVGAPPEVVSRLEKAAESALIMGKASSSTSTSSPDPALDQFMEAYCEMLTKYEQELSKPFKEAMLFLSRVDAQFKSLSLSLSNPPPPHPHPPVCGELDRNGSSDEDIDAIENYIDPQAEDRELKGQLLRKYSGYLGSLKQEFLKKRKKGKLPKEARQQLLDWWAKHYKWPYPSESQKLVLAESTGLDQKQINNWFINQRKRHWKPSEDVQFVMMDAAHPHYFIDSGLANPFPLDCAPTLL